MKLCKELSKIDAYVNKTCGLHVHLDMRDLLNEGKRTTTRVHNLVQCLPFLSSLVPESRRSNSFCKLGKTDRNSSDRRYYAINTESMKKHKTIEVRLHSGTVEFEKITNWVKLLYSITRFKRISDPVFTLNQYCILYANNASLNVRPNIDYLERRIEKFKTQYNDIASGATKSCGCLQPRTTHGMKHTGEWSCWQAMKERILNPNSPAYPRYGGAGLGIFEPWIKDFMAFYNHIGPRPSPAHSIDRIRNEYGYFPGNVRWSTPKEQSNNRTSNYPLTFHSHTMNLCQWAETVGIKALTIATRLKRGWSIEDALFKPVDVRFRKKKSLKYS